MKDIKELIYAAVEENALKFQELVNAQLQVRAYDAIEALRPEVGASMFGEAKKMEDDEEEMEDEDEEDEEMEDEDEMDDKKKSMKEALHPNQQKIDVVDDEKIDAKDFAKLRQMKKMKEEVNLQEITTKSGADVDRNLDDHDPDEHGDIPDRKPDHELETHGGLTLHVHHVKDSKGKTKHTIINHVNDPAGGGTFVVKGHAHPKHILSSYNRAEREDMDESVNLDELSTDKLTNYAKAANASRASLNKKWDQGKASWRDKEKVMNREKGENRAHKIVDRRALVDKEMNEVAMPKNQADWQALINHQIQVTGHPVATDAQFRSTLGKDKSKIASLEPGEDKLQYATAQGGNVKQ